MSKCETCNLYSVHGDRGVTVCKQYVEDRDMVSADKGSHKQRSIGNDKRSGGHIWHWKKEKNDAEKPKT